MRALYGLRVQAATQNLAKQFRCHYRENALLFEPPMSVSSLFSARLGWRGVRRWQVRLLNLECHQRVLQGCCYGYSQCGGR
jgi:hypothetical protein